MPYVFNSQFFLALQEAVGSDLDLVKICERFRAGLQVPEFRMPHLRIH